MSSGRIARAVTLPVATIIVLLTGMGAAAATQDDDEDDRGRDRSESASDPIAEESFGDVTVEVLELERTSGRTVTLRFALVNGGDEAYDLGDAFGEFVVDFTMGGVYLFDDAGSTKYLSLREGKEADEASQGCVCTELESSGEEIEPGDQREFFVKFPAPPKATDTVSVVLPPLGTVDAVEIAT